MDKEVQGMSNASPFIRKLQVTSPAFMEAREVVVRIGLPERDPLPGGDFRVLVEISGLDEPYNSFIHGVDELHAFLSGCWMVSEMLPALAPKGSRVTWLGQDDLGFGAARQGAKRRPTSREG